MATYPNILAWRIPCREEPGRLQSHGVEKSWTRLSNFHFQMGTQCVVTVFHRIKNFHNTKAKMRWDYIFIKFFHRSPPQILVLSFSKFLRL